MASSADEAAFAHRLHVGHVTAMPALDFRERLSHEIEGPECYDVTKCVLEGGVRSAGS